MSKAGKGSWLIAPSCRVCTAAKGRACRRSCQGCPSCRGSRNPRRGWAAVHWFPGDGERLRLTPPLPAQHSCYLSLPCTPVGGEGLSLPSPGCRVLWLGLQKLLIPRLCPLRGLPAAVGTMAAKVWGPVGKKVWARVGPRGSTHKAKLKVSKIYTNIFSPAAVATHFLFL